jgi:hydrogenase-4 component B
VIAALLLAGVAAIAAGGGLAVVPRTFRAGLQLQAAGLVLAALTSIGWDFTSALQPHVGVDRLSGFFLGTLGVAGAPALVFATRYLERNARGRAVGALTAVFLLTLVLVVCARDAFTLLGGWELMTLVPAAIILVASGDELARRTVFVYVAITHLGGAGAWVSVLLLSHAGALGGGRVLAHGSALQAAIAVTAIVGFGTKAGVMPLHAWLPRAHPLAPAHVSALMSGVMIKVAVYGLIRVLVDWSGVLPLWISVTVLALGALSAVGGVVYALFQHDLKRLLAFHSIENIGIILLGIGACTLLRSRGNDAWASFALAAALLHTLNHAVFKSLLFLGAGAFEKAVGSLELDRLGGLLRRMPWTGGAFLVGAMAIAGLPPLNGFASEWLTLRSLLHVPASGGVVDGLAGALALAGLAATVALAVYCFVKVVGLVLLGRPRRELVASAVEAPWEMRLAVASLAAACLVLGVAPGLLFGVLTGIAPWASAGPLHVGLQLPETGSLSTGGIALALGVLTGAFLLLRGRRVAPPAPTWACGQAVEPQLSWTSAGFTKPLRLVLEAVLRPHREIEVQTRGSVVQSISYQGHVPHLLDERLYGPVLRLALAGAAQARRLQSGRLSTYVAYLIGLVLLLLAAAKIGLIG